MSNNEQAHIYTEVLSYPSIVLVTLVVVGPEFLPTKQLARAVQSMRVRIYRIII